MVRIIEFIISKSTQVRAVTEKRLRNGRICEQPVNQLHSIVFNAKEKTERGPAKSEPAASVSVALFRI